MRNEMPRVCVRWVTLTEPQCHMCKVSSIDKTLCLVQGTTRNTSKTKMSYVYVPPTNQNDICTWLLQHLKLMEVRIWCLKSIHALKGLNTKFTPLPFQGWISDCHPHPLQASNCCRNSRFGSGCDDLKWVANEINKLLIIEQFHENVVLKTPNFRTLSQFFRDARLCFNAIVRI